MKLSVLGTLGSLILLCSSLLAARKPQTIEVVSQVVYQQPRVSVFANSLHYRDLPMINYWTIIVLNKENWDEAVLKYKANTVTAFTLPHLDQTFLNGPWLQKAGDWEAKHTIAHEAGHLICKCNGENEANKVADKLLK